VRLFNEI